MKKVKRDKAWMTDFNVERNYSSPFRVEELMEDWALTHSAVVQVRTRMVLKYRVTPRLLNMNRRLRHQPQKVKPKI